MLLMNIILAVCFVPIWPILYFIIRNLVKPKKNIILGVTLPQSVHENPEVQDLCKAFKKWFDIITLPLLPLLFVPFFISKMGPAMTWYMTWFLLLLVAPFVVYGIYNSKLKALKHEHNWYGEAAGKVLVDLKVTAVPVRRISYIWFLLPTIISLIPVAYSILDPADAVNIWIYVMFTAMIAFFWLIYHMVYRTRAEVINDDTTLTMALTCVRRHNWNKFWIISIWATSALNILIWVFANNMIAFLVATIVYTFILLIAAVSAEFSTRSAQQKLTSTDMGEIYRDEDDYWLWGMFYNNPNDDSFLVFARVGINMTVNLAKLGGKILMVFAVLTIVAMPFIGIWVWVEEATPTALVLTDSNLIARHTRDQYVIPLDSIETIELLTEMPWIISRDAGSGFEDLAKGRFTVSNHGTSFLCIQTNNPPFIMVVANDRTYFINDANSSVTTGIFNEIKFGQGSN